jgi:hypothetical protein
MLNGMVGVHCELLPAARAQQQPAAGGPPRRRRRGPAVQHRQRELTSRCSVMTLEVLHDRRSHCTWVRHMGPYGTHAGEHRLHRRLLDRWSNKAH